MPVGGVFRSFGRQIFQLYERYPLLCNSVAGGTVYFASETVVQVQALRDEAPSSSSGAKPSWWACLKVVDWKRVTEIGALGSMENGIVMLTWYKALNKYVGDSSATTIVLAKCALDQAFFATQQDGIFLALCALDSSESFAEALQEVKRTFLTTWINDCSVWPLVNFVGFAFVPMTLQPTYMSTVQFFWQIYISSVASGGGHDLEETEQETFLAQMFAEIDCDGNGFIDGEELQTALWKRSINVTRDEIGRMITEANLLDRQDQQQHQAMSAIHRHDGDHSKQDDLLSFHQFKLVVNKSIELANGAGGASGVLDPDVARLWSNVAQKPMSLEKGAKAVLSRMNEASKKGTEAKKGADAAAAAAAKKQSADVKLAAAVNESSSSHSSSTDHRGASSSESASKGSVASSSAAKQGANVAVDDLDVYTQCVHSLQLRGEQRKAVADKIAARKEAAAQMPPERSHAVAAALEVSRSSLQHQQRKAGGGAAVAFDDTCAGAAVDRSHEVYKPCDPLFYRKQVLAEDHRSEDDYERHVARLIREIGDHRDLRPIAESVERQISEQQLFSVEEKRQRLIARRAAIHEELVAEHREEHFRKARNEALVNAQIGGSLLMTAALLRKLVFKV
jgi:hypothetical protein